MGLAFTITLLVWLTAEVVLQVVQWVRGGRSRTREWRSLGTIIVTAVVAGFLAGAIRAKLPALGFTLPYAAYAVILVVAWVGIALRLWSIITLGRYFRAIVHIQQDHQLVRTGPYRVLRHPSYTGMLLALLAFSVTNANIGAIIVYDACILAAVWYRIRIEERVLLDGLGDEYAQYMGETHRLIPGIW
ncbi:MAG: isoprenylcysteine carboxylmethyltransferase family protein [Nocardia sp.]|nr:isoprenylcysteine carboxylmethyltransferase family protein [Nocardia sp.]